MKSILTLIVFISFYNGYTQIKPKLTVEKIMQDPKWMGTSPSNIFWAENSKTIYFDWNPDRNLSDSLYGYSINAAKTTRLTNKAAFELPANNGVYSADYSKKVYSKNGDLFLYFEKTNQQKQLTITLENETEPSFTADDQHIIYRNGNDIFLYHIENGTIKQLTNFENGPQKTEKKKSDEEVFLEKDQLDIFEVLKTRKEKTDLAKKNIFQPKQPKKIYLEDKRLSLLKADPSLNYVVYFTFEAAKNGKNTVVPNYLASSGYTEELPARNKVGSMQGTTETYIYGIAADTVIKVNFKSLPGLTDLPDFIKESKDSTLKKRKRTLAISEISWSPMGSNLIGIVRATDNKDRWIVSIDPKSGDCKTIDRQRDEAWVAGPGIGWSQGGATLGWLNENEIYYQSEAPGFSHLYKSNLVSLQKIQLTKGKFEILKVSLAKDKTRFFITSNQVHPGEQHFYHLNINGGEPVKITSMIGANDVSVSPDERYLAIRYSYSNKPWELYFQKNEPNSSATQITNSQTDEFKAYPWREPKIITFYATDGQEIYGRIYEPTIKTNKSKPAVIFVHGAGYLQNAHKWWSSYFREYMFHNLLVDQGFTVLDIDYRASAGYGRDVRTGIYRHMGGKDLSDNVDAAKLLVSKYGIDAKRIGIYGGSYGGFITLMAMFTTPDVFKAGAALRPVTDWAAYNHVYTSNILNEPQTDSLAYRRSSPIYFANGLKNKLLICHGMVDVNVHYQDAVRLSQKLIELIKENWEMASYPVEDHGFVEPSSWTDEYKRILKLFEGL
jgi:dipeptidyl aminopeptidase/acylaminoacyl peptidase